MSRATISRRIRGSEEDARGRSLKRLTTGPSVSSSPSVSSISGVSVTFGVSIVSTLGELETDSVAPLVPERRFVPFPSLARIDALVYESVCDPCVFALRVMVAILPPLPL